VVLPISSEVLNICKFEDGLPVLLFGDIAFATADIFTRFDGNGRIEAIHWRFSFNIVFEILLEELSISLVKLGKLKEEL
jgi:hypothetical protein